MIKLHYKLAFFLIPPHIVSFCLAVMTGTPSQSSLHVFSLEDGSFEVLLYFSPDRILKDTEVTKPLYPFLSATRRIDRRAGQRSFICLRNHPRERCSVMSYWVRAVRPRLVS